MHNKTVEQYKIEWRKALFALKEDLKQNKINHTQILMIADVLYSKYTVKGIMPNIDTLNAHLQLCANDTAALKVIAFYQQKHTIETNASTTNVLISLSPNYDTAIYYFDELLSSGKYPNTYTLNAFIPFCKTYKEAKVAFNKIYRYNVQPNTQSYNAFLSLTTNAVQQAEILADMEAQKVLKNLVTFNTLISVANDFKAALLVYEDIKKYFLQPTTNTFITLLKKTTTLLEVIKVEELHKKAIINTDDAFRQKVLDAKRRV
jgi:Pentatricopeptide repeat domain